MLFLFRSLGVLAVVLGLAGWGGAAFGFGGDSSAPASSAAKANPDYVRAEKAVKDKDFKAAVPLLEKVIGAEPRNANAFNYLGYSHRKLGDRDKALGYYRRALDIEPTHPGANEYLGELYLELDALPEAEGRLATLEQSCAKCEETRELREEIKKYKAKKGS